MRLATAREKSRNAPRARQTPRRNPRRRKRGTCHDAVHRPRRGTGHPGQPGHTPPWLRDLAVDAFIAKGWRVEVDRPYSGALVPAALYRKDRRVLSVMVEVNRALYMDEGTGGKLAGFRRLAERCRRAVAGIVRNAGAWAAP